MSVIAATDGRLAAPRLAIDPRPHRLDRIELGVLALFVVLSMWVLAPDLYQWIVVGRAWTGTDGLFSTDQLQYLAWIRDASRHLLVSNMFVLHPTPADYLQPMVAISGGLVALGVAPWVALLVWKPVALVAVLLTIRALVHRTVAGVGARRAALALALFAGPIGISIDMWLPFWTWGYPFALVALAAALAALLSYQRARTANRLPWAAAALGALAGWLHPWQGEVLVLVLIGTEAVLWSRGRRPRAASSLLVVGSMALPLVYYAVLGHLDPSWRLAQQADAVGYPFWRAVLELSPLLVPAVLAYRVRPAGLVDVAMRVWPIAAFASFVLDEHGLGSSPSHAFLGISVPLALLAVQGVKGIRWPIGVPRATLAALAVAALTVPVAVDQLSYTQPYLLPGRHQGNFLHHGELQALDYVNSQPGSGAVLSDFHIGVAVPAQTGRRTYLGNPYWSEPRFAQRQVMAQHLLLKWLPSGQARAFVLSTGARYVVVDCWANSSLLEYLGPIIESVHKFACARVYTIKPQQRRTT